MKYLKRKEMQPERFPRYVLQKKTQERSSAMNIKLCNPGNFNSLKIVKKKKENIHFKKCRMSLECYIYSLNTSRPNHRGLVYNTESILLL